VQKGVGTPLQRAPSTLHPWFHGIINKSPIHESYTVAFVEQHSLHSVDISEDKKMNKSNAQINVWNMILHRMK